MKKPGFYLLFFLMSNYVFSQNQQTIDSLQQILQTNISEAKKADGYNLIANEYRYTDSAKVMRYTQKAIRLSEKVNYTIGIADALYYRGWLTMYKGYYSEARKLYRKTLETAQKTGYEKGLSNAYNGLGATFWYKGKYAKALEFYQKSLYLSELTGDKKGIARSLNNLGVIYRTQYNYAKALQVFQRSLKLAAQVGNQRGVAYIYNNIGLIYKMQGRYPGALNFYLKSLAIRKKIGDKSGIAESYFDLGELSLAGKKYVEAQAFLAQALALQEQIGTKSLSADFRVSLGIAYYYRKSYAQAEKHLKQSIKIARELGNVRIVRDAARYLAKVCQVAGKHQQAYQNLELYNEMADSLSNVEIVRKLTRMDEKYASEKREDSLRLVQAKETALLNADLKQHKTKQQMTFMGLRLALVLVLVLLFFYREKQRNNHKLNKANGNLASVNKQLKIQAEEIQAQTEELKQINEQLMEMDEFKQGVTGMIVHDLKNPLNTLLAYAQTPEIKQSAQQMLHMVLNILDVQKLESAELQLHWDVINLNDLIGEAVAQVKVLSQQKNVSVSAKITQQISVKTDRDICLRILVNLLTNAIKHTPLNTNIHLNIELVNNEVKVLIADEGEGVPTELQDKIFDKFFSIEAQKNNLALKSTGLGLAFCKLATEAQEGYIGVTNLPGKGACFWFTLQLVNVEDTVEVPVTESLKNAIDFSASDKTYLRPYIKQLSQMAIYEMSKIKSLVDGIAETKNVNIRQWKEWVLEATFSMNEVWLDDLKRQVLREV